MDTFSEFGTLSDPFSTATTGFLPTQKIEDPLLALGSTSSQASALYTPQPLYGVRSETWQQGAGGLPGSARNGFLASTGQGVSVYQRGDEFGQAVETGDFNGDGYMDLAIGSPGEGASKYSDDSGKKYDKYRYNGPGLVNIIYGSVTGLSNNTQTFQASDVTAFGRSLAAGDFNNDGKMDLAVGSHNGITILHGGNIGLRHSGVAFGNGSYALEVGDFNGDGTDDLAAGNPFANNEEGSVTIFHGTANVGLTSATQTWSQNSPGIFGGAEGAPDRRFNSKDEWGDRFGFSLAAGDFDGDGKDDLAIGTPGERFGMGGISNVPGGAVNVLYGSQSGLTAVMNQFWDQNGTENESQFNLEGGIEAGDQFGYDVAAGDFNGDGIADLAIGVPGEDYSTSASVDDSNGGAVAIIYGKRYQGLTNAGNQLIDQNSPGMSGAVERDDRFGESLAVGDINHDGRSDLMVGVPGETEGSSRGGAVSVIVGSDRGLAPTINTLIDQRHITGASLEDADLFGAALATGDFDGNGSDDLAIGVPGEKVGSGLFNHAGEVNVVYGDKYLPTITVSSSNGVISEVSPNSEQFVLTRPGGFGSAMPITLRSVGTAKLGVDFTVSGASVNGDFVTVQMPYGSIFAPETRTAFQVTPLQDSLKEGDERIEFVVVKGDRYTVDPGNLAGVTLKDPVPSVVDTLVDENDGDFSPGDVSLREVIEGSIAGTTISFAPELQGTIALNSQLLINKNLTIDGTGADRISISGKNASRVFEIASGAVVEIEGLAIANGLTDANGGGIVNQGTLTVNNSILRNNSANYGGAIHNTGTLTVNNSTLKDNSATSGGGAIYGDWGSVSIAHSTIDRNSSLQGGGISNFSNLTVTNSTLSNNSAVNGTDLAKGGGIYQGFGTATLTNSTVSGNQSAFYGAGIHHADGDLTVIHSTITNNTASVAGSGIYHYLAGGNAAIGSTIVAGNHTLSNPIGDVYGSFTSLDYNLIGDTAGGIGFAQLHDRTGYYGNVLNPKLGSLQDNGGSTWTHALLFDSPAIDGAAPNAFSSDQRGIFSEDGNRDIGAFEWRSPSLAINDVSRSEGNNGIVNFDFTVSLNAPSWKPVSVTYMTAPQTALPGSDFAFMNANLTFNPGETSKTISVMVVGDRLREADETFFVNLLSPGNATLTDSQGVGTILNDDIFTLIPERPNLLIAEAPDSGTVLNLNNDFMAIAPENGTVVELQDITGRVLKA